MGTDTQVFVEGQQAAGALVGAGVVGVADGGQGFVAPGPVEPQGAGAGGGGPRDAGRAVTPILAEARLAGVLVVAVLTQEAWGTAAHTHTHRDTHTEIHTQRYTHTETKVVFSENALTTSQTSLYTITCETATVCACVCCTSECVGTSLSIFSQTYKYQCG